MPEDDDRELFEKALASMSRGDVFRGKFGAPTDGESTSSERPEDAGSREEIQRLREQREMENAFAGVVPIDQNKYHVREPEAPVGGGSEEQDLRAEFEAAMAAEAAPPEPEPQLVPLEQLAPDDVQSLNLRGMDVGQAIGKLGLFVDLAAKERHELVRIRVGSNPPLLNAVKEWFRGPGLVYTERFEIAQEHADAAVFARIRHSP